mgnify:CR=1 FL=1|tara:strand:- start:3653 stop:4735 length:1083 start_codon:yes stop_codon:yes gene_type:complete
MKNIITLKSGKKIGGDSPTYIIAEIGINHNGRFDIAKKLIEESAKAGVDAVKFQKRDAESIMIKKNINKDPIGYLSKNENDISSEQPKYGSWSYPDLRVELSDDDYIELQKISFKNGVDFFASPWDEKSLEFLINIDVPIIKIPSVEIKNLSFLEKCSQSDTPIILSTGTATQKDVDQALDILKSNNDSVILLQCTSAYPSKLDEIDLNVINTFIEKYSCPIGFSGHEPGINVPVGAVAKGAKLIEKHVTLNKKMNGTDHLASIDMSELTQMVNGIREIEKALGGYKKNNYKSEEILVSILGKSLVAKKNLKIGHIISEDDLTTKGPPTGIGADKFYEIIGKKIINDKEADDTIFPGDID